MRRRKDDVFTAAEQLAIEKMATVPPPTNEEVQYIRKLTRARTAYGGLQQIMRAAPQPDLKDEIIAHYAMFLENDGIEFSLARLQVATTNAAMDCLSRANTEVANVRDFELNQAVKLSLVAAALAKALDQHQAFRQRYVEEKPFLSVAESQGPDANVPTSPPTTPKKK